MSKLWLTYAWDDNEDKSVDHLYHQLKKHGVEVRMDRTELWVGEQIWENIDSAIRSKEIDGWAFYVTEASLRSGPCREELQYALKRAIKDHGSFPLIGILPHPVDDAILPAAISTRLYVRTNMNDWEQQIADRLEGTRSDPRIAEPSPIGVTLHKDADENLVEIWPRTGTWSPTFASAPIGQTCQVDRLYRFPRGRPGVVSTLLGGGYFRNNGYDGLTIQEPIDATFSVFVAVTEFSGHIVVGGPEGSWTIYLAESGGNSVPGPLIERTKI